MITRLLIIAITPAISIALAMYLSDRYDREPIGLLLKTFLLGGLIIIPAVVIERVLISFNIFSGLLSAAYTAFVVAGLTEEFLKREVVLRLSYKSQYFDEKLDGIVYAVFSALGFATIENIMYLFRFGMTYNSYVGLYRGILSVPAHSIFAVTMGYYLSLAKYSNDPVKKQRYHRRSLTIPIILHGFFNFILMSGVPILALLFIPYVIYIWRINQVKLNEYLLDSREHHDGEDIDFLDE